jgi:cytochrome c oxidase assembly protein subunit 15
VPDLLVPGQTGSAAPRLTWLARVRRWLDVVADPSTASMRRIAAAGVVAAAAIIPTGAAVRLSKSGLGCTNWPKCTATSLVASGVTGDPLIHRWIEFGNRLVTVAIFVIAIVVFVAAWRFRDGLAEVGRGGASRERGRRRPDLIWLASAQPAGIVAQAVIGGIVVKTNLSPFWVSLHYLATVPVLAAAVALQVRCAEGTGRPRPLVPRLVRLVAGALAGAVALMLAVGTLVTGTGPLAGAPSVPRYRFMSLTAVTQLHADIGWALGVLAVALVLMLMLVDAPARAIRFAWIVLGLIGAQGALGYAQYFAGLPAGLVWVHVASTALIWIAVLRLGYALRDRTDTAALRPAGAAEPGAAEPGAAEPAADPLPGDAPVR